MADLAAILKNNYRANTCHVEFKKISIKILLKVVLSDKMIKFGAI